MFDPVSSTQPPSQSGTSRHTALCSAKSPCVSSPVTILVVHATVLCTFHPAHGLPIIFPSTPAKDAGSADFDALYVTPWYVIHTSPTIQQQIHTPYTTNISISSFSSMPIISLIPHCGPHTILLQHTILNSTVNCYIRRYYPTTIHVWHYSTLTDAFAPNWWFYDWFTTPLHLHENLAEPTRAILRIETAALVTCCTTLGSKFLVRWSINLTHVNINYSHSKSPSRTRLQQKCSPMIPRWFDDWQI